MRHAITGFRPGEVFHTPAGQVITHPNDGGATLTDDQIKYFKEAGYKLVKVDETPPAEPEVPVDPAAAEVLASQTRAAAQVAELTNKVPKPETDGK